MTTYKAKLPEIQLKYKASIFSKAKVSTSQEANTIIKNFYNADTIEYIETVYALYLNRANNTIGWQMISTGGMSAAIIDLKVLFASALTCGASGIILSHNHPSGRIEPSNEDISITEKISKVGKLMDIKLLDHLIVTSDSYYSLADNGRF